MLIALIILIPIVGALISWLIGRKNEIARDFFAAAVTAAVLLLTFFLPKAMPSLKLEGVFAYGLTFTTDGFRAVYAIITAIMWVGTSLFSLEYFSEEREGLNRYWFFILLTFGATEGVMLSGDLMTSFVFFEILSFTSFTWVIHEETAEAIRAAYTYLFIAVIGGLVLFMGLLMLQNAVGTLVYSELAQAAAASGKNGQIFAAGICILLGFGAKAGMFPLHIWLPKAHPVAPSPASALLSGILTKVGVYGILMTTVSVFAENQTYGCILLVLGEITMFLGALLAVFSVNLKRTLACSSMSQIGFILTGVAMNVLLTACGSGEGAETALSGLMLHMTNHSLIKLTLFMCAGVVIMKLHTLTLDDIRGWGRNKVFLKISFALGALGISGVPFFNGYISKTLLHEGIVEGIHGCAGLRMPLHVAEWVFLISGGLTFGYMLKLFICIFIEKNKDVDVQARYDADRTCMNGLSTAVIFGSSLFCVICGQPAVMTRLAAFMTANDEILSFRAFTPENLKGGAISLAIGALVYLLIIRRVLYRNGSYVNLWPEKLDLENLLYRPLLTEWIPKIFGTIFGGSNVITNPRANFVVLIASILGRALVDSTDAVVTLFRKTLVREKKTVTLDTEKPGFWWTLRDSTVEAAAPITQNFTFAMMMTCVGILLVLGVLAFCLYAV